MEKAQIAVVMVPLPCQSHLNQLLQLSHLISSHGLPVHYVGSATHNRQAKLRAGGLNLDSNDKIHFHDLPTPAIACPDPNPDAFGKLPVHLGPANAAYMNLRQPIGVLLRDLASRVRRLVIIHDRVVSEAVQDAVLIPNAETYTFNCLSAFDLFFILWETMGKPFDVGEGIQNLPSLKEFLPEGVLHFILSKPENFKYRAGDIHNTSRLIEGRYIDLLAKEEISGNKKQWAIIPSQLVKLSSTTNRRHKCLDWLDKQAPKSVILVSFGTTISFSDEEARELAVGLEESKQKFLWVLRDADKADIFAGEARRIHLPEGFEQRVEGMGMIVRDWAPQLEILAHESTGGFLSHCGWNSCLESMTMGVPIAAWPIHSDQPLNAIFLSEVLKIGLVAREWARREELLKASTIRSAVERLMASEEGSEMRKRAEELGGKLRESMEEGGISSEELESFITHITR